MVSKVTGKCQELPSNYYVYEVCIQWMCIWEIYGVNIEVFLWGVY